jgi:hypothetical protein
MLLLVLSGLVAFGVWMYRHLPSEYVPIATGALGFIASKSIESWRESRTRLYKKKREAYVKLLTPWREIVVLSMMSKKDVNWSRPQMQKVYEAAFDTLLYASDDVVRCYGNFLSVGTEPDRNADEVGRRLSALLKAMRKDLGNRFTTLNEVEIMAMLKPMNLDERNRLMEQIEPKEKSKSA